ncbi:hypothetical protein J6590_004725 [Homalodisca vitripennis]|nr:hypothetical protein J6590_004725 [Homalodisca vitripennis]
MFDVKGASDFAALGTVKTMSLTSGVPESMCLQVIKDQRRKSDFRSTANAQAGGLLTVQRQDRLAVTHPSSSNARHCLIWLSSSHGIRLTKKEVNKVETN